LGDVSPLGRSVLSHQYINNRSVLPAVHSREEGVPRVRFDEAGQAGQAKSKGLLPKNAKLCPHQHCIQLLCNHVHAVALM